jgi:serine/threonine protein kinase
VVPVLAAAEVTGYPPGMRVVEIVMPYYPRGSVTDALLRGERFSPLGAVGLAQAGLRGLSELHERHSVLHRDLKSSNMLLTDDAHRLLVGDLGLAGRMASDGTVAAVDNPQLYSPPELVATGSWSRASDVFGMGLVLRELLLGPFPYDSYTRTEIVQRLMRGQSPLRLVDRTLPPWVARDLRRAIRKATQPSPSARYQTARDFASALANAQVADWTRVDEHRWEAPYRTRPSRFVAVEITAGKRGLKVDLLVRRTTWRRAQPTTIAPSIGDAQVAEVFDQATKIAFDR